MNFKCNNDPNNVSIFDKPRTKEEKAIAKAKNDLRVANSGIKKNIKKKPKKKKSNNFYFVHKFGVGVKLSAAEKKIAKVLRKHDLLFISEVSFTGLNSDKGVPLRFDFYLPKHNVCIEYDGKEAHSTLEVQLRDMQKTEFCKKKGIRLIRYDIKQWRNLEAYIVDLMLELKVNLKPVKPKKLKNNLELWK